MNIQYYRKNSAASKLTPKDLDEQYIANAKFLHLTGITPALSKSCYETTLAAIRIAKKNNVKVVFDPNLRKKLWRESEAKKILIDISLKSDIFLPGLSEAEFLTGFQKPKDIIEYLKGRGIPTVVLKDGENGAFYSLNNYDICQVPSYEVANVVDPVGAGDAFAAGLLSGLLDGLSMSEAVKRGNKLGL